MLLLNKLHLFEYKLMHGGRMIKYIGPLLLLSVLFLSDYALAQIPECPCDTAELSNGLTGNEIIEIVCPGGSLGDDTGIFSGPDVIGVFLENPPSTTYLTKENNVGDKFCEINSDGVLPTTLQITDLEYRDCRERLIEGCSLGVRSIPALSVWGLIALACVLGMTVLFAVHRKKSAA